MKVPFIPDGLVIYLIQKMGLLLADLLVYTISKTGKWRIFYNELNLCFSSDFFGSDVCSSSFLFESVNFQFDVAHNYVMYYILYCMHYFFVCSFLFGNTFKHSQIHPLRR